jgi:hypothetical protein
MSHNDKVKVALVALSAFGFLGSLIAGLLFAGDPEYKQ